MNNNWPTAPLIRIVRGYDVRTGELEGEYAVRDSDGDYYTPNIGTLIKDSNDRIDEWEEVTAIPTAALKRLQDAFRGVDMVSSLVAAVQDVTSHLPADKPSALDQAVTDTKNIGARGILEDFTLNDRISLLLAAVRDTHTGEDLRYRLAWVVRLAYTWADLEDPSRDALEGIRNRAATEVGRCGGDLATLARQAGDVAGSTSEGRSPRSALIALGSRALAWAAEIIEEEDK